MNLFAKKILSVDLRGVHRFLNTSCHRAAFPRGVLRRRRACRDTGRLQILSPLPFRIRLHPFFNLAYWETSQHSQWSLYDLCQLSARDEYFSSFRCILTNRRQYNFWKLQQPWKRISFFKLVMLHFWGECVSVVLISFNGNLQGSRLWLCTLRTEGLFNISW